MYYLDIIEKKVASKEIYNGAVVKLRVDDVELPNGEKAKREIVEHTGAVCVLPIDDDGTVYTVRQFRYAFLEPMLEIPAGKLDSNDEEWLSAAKRELSEEVGLTAENWIYIGDFRPSVAIFTEVIHMYLARGLKKGEQHLDEDEFLNVERYPLDTLVDMVMDGSIKDGKTIASVLKVKRILEQEKQLKKGFN